MCCEKFCQHHPRLQPNYNPSLLGESHHVYGVIFDRAYKAQKKAPDWPGQ
jgi:hypothetical protein